MGRTVPSFRIVIAQEKQEWKDFRNALDKSERKSFDEMWDIPKLYVSACSNSCQLVPLQPIIISLLFHHYKELKECISAVKEVGEGQVEVSCDPESGSTFPVGTTTVTCTATDAAGNEATETFTVTVQDTTAPILTVPEDITVVDSNGDGVEVVTFEVTAQDNVDGTATLEEDNTLTQDDVGGDIFILCAPGSGNNFSSGVMHTIECRATDEAGNEARASFIIDTLN